MHLDLFPSPGCDTTWALTGKGTPAVLHPRQEPLRLLRAQDFVQVGRGTSSYSGLRATARES